MNTQKAKDFSESQSPLVNLDVLMRNEDPVYVYNRSKPKGDIAIIMYGIDSAPFLVVIPKTWIPVALTDQVPHSVLKGSTDLRRFLTNKMLVLVDCEKAEKILMQKDGAEELSRLNVSRYAAWEDAASTASTAGGTTTDIDDMMKEAKSLDNIHIGLKELLERDIPNEEKYHMLRSNEENYEKDELEYISVTTDSKRIKKWALALCER